MKPKMQIPVIPNPRNSEFQNFDALVRTVMFKKSIGRKRHEAKLAANPVPPQVEHQEERLPRP